MVRKIDEISISKTGKDGKTAVIMSISLANPIILEDGEELETGYTYEEIINKAQKMVNDK